MLMLIISGLPLLLLGVEEGPIDSDRYRPGYVDELIYYHETGTFLNYGFNDGYYTFEERPAPLTGTIIGNLYLNNRAPCPYNQRPSGRQD